MRKQMKKARKYFIINIDEPYAPEIYEVLKKGQIEKDQWPEGDISFEEWVKATFGDAPEIKVFRGIKPLTGNLLVTINGKELSPERSQKIFNHSPNGFAWGYDGSGPAQLALAILLECVESADEAITFHQDFKREIVAGFKIDHPWILSAECVETWLELKRKGGSQ